MDNHIKPFYDQLDQNCTKITAYDEELVLSDFKAHVSKENIYIGIIEKHSFHYAPDNGLRLHRRVW